MSTTISIESEGVCISMSFEVSPREVVGYLLDRVEARQNERDQRFDAEEPARKPFATSTLPRPNPNVVQPGEVRTKEPRVRLPQQQCKWAGCEKGADGRSKSGLCKEHNGRVAAGEHLPDVRTLPLPGTNGVADELEDALG